MLPTLFYVLLDFIAILYAGLYKRRFHGMDALAGYVSSMSGRLAVQMGYLSGFGAGGRADLQGGLAAELFVQSIVYAVLHSFIHGGSKMAIKSSIEDALEVASISKVGAAAIYSFWKT